MNGAALIPDTQPAAAQDLAAGFAEHAAAWSAALGAPPAARQALARAARQLALAGSAGHVCLPLEELAGEDDPAALREHLLESGVVAGEDAARLPGSAHPLVLDGAGRLYLRRHYDLEGRLAAALRARTARAAGEGDPQALGALLADFFPPRADGRPDWQKLAVALALLRRLTVISGGPGTGKTTTVAALLGCLLSLRADLRIALAAPTGKAAARMLEALRARSERLPADLRARLPQEAWTVHRLLGVTPQAGRFRLHAGNPLPFDVVVVDEASMLDLALAARLVDAVPPAARLILLGDKDQLAAVEAGAVFAELSAGSRFSDECAAALEDLAGHRPADAGEPAALPDSVVWLRESHRFAAGSGIGRLAAGINGGEAAALLAWLREAADPALGWLEDAGRAPAAEVLARCEAGYGAYADALRHGGNDPAAAFAAFDRFRVLAAVHDGPRGVRALNARLAEWLRGALAHAADPGAGAEWYPGRPVIVLRNDYLLGLFNGDVGLTLADADGRLQVWFPAAGGGFRALSPVRLPAVDTAFALTVHKAQGSEFEEVLMVLPDAESPVLTRELLYTGVTRAARRVALAGSAAAFAAACARRTVRHSGLADRLAP
ncbi:exodeoxyribonuclease V subunit alpha [Pseudothauera rhizosphaerae]|uniref:RecBCD enzyme subunit RecD n=1 Tax=Pseudothauera rhizosphaerae TaxID=2565932 RepID=A0A4S4ACU1_9RHOO|nr:exodeoxyribonuclease V subunit alpha [Pseudothauera rhizosphaerae]THF56898.1 exodeoxyribonuclease V subunit alpha [Pseudothauera rhizosphaerae]